ncbi:Gfo/Idh/MocA family protein [Scatolibacter rhodanostii]|uniref:Gfo/Idh/MocA family protein n=1 Tax=Scatolibacter rhodanostii TaxID=2014781 RepID=UPI000C075472|nr:Gfo/Idh/MocA family oxidoreductase [Scatolibacter rhodanostii]
MLKLILIGAGQRGTIYADYAYYNRKAEIKAIVEPNLERRSIAQNKYEVSPEFVFDNFQLFLDKGKIGDAVILSSMDKNHYEQAMSLLDLGYDLLLEKPISPEPQECIKIRDKANALGRKVIVCHVLRYTSFFSTIKEIIDSNQLGKIVSIQHNENIGNFHMAHSFVRGNWRKSSETSPLVMQKSCHDMDILSWLIGSEAKSISSFGDLQYFKASNAPANSTNRCLHCPAAENCRFDARKMYLPIRGDWPATVVSPDQSEEGLLKALETSPYGRCVYRCDNDVCDNQVSIIQFKNGVNVSFTLSAFTNKMSRTLKIMCENGEIRGDDSLNRIEVIPFASNQSDSQTAQLITPKIVSGFHGGGDTGLMQDFFNIMESESNENESRSSIDRSVESHIMAYAAELSRVSRKSIDIDELKHSLSEETAR